MDNKYEYIGIDYILKNSEFIKEIESQVIGARHLVNDILLDKFNPECVTKLDAKVETLSEEALADLISYCNKQLVELEFTLYYEDNSDDTIIMDIFIYNMASDFLNQSSMGMSMSNTYSESYNISRQLLIDLMTVLMNNKIAFEFRTDTSPIDEIKN